jgi:PEP-CTERM motif
VWLDGIPDWRRRSFRWRRFFVTKVSGIFTGLPQSWIDAILYRCFFLFFIHGTRFAYGFVSILLGKQIMKRLLKLSCAVALTAGLFLPLSAHAGVVGDSVNATYYFPNLSTVYEDDGTQIVNPTATWTAFGQITSTLSDTQLVITFEADSAFDPATFNGDVYTDFTKNWAAVTVDPATTLSSFNAGDITVSGDQLEVNFAGVGGFSTTDEIVLDIGPIPEPASIALLGVGMFGIRLVRRKRG